MEIISGPEAQKLINSQIDLYEKDLLSKLSVFEPVSSTRMWLSTIRSIEELINLPFSIDEDDLSRYPILSVELRKFSRDPLLFSDLKSAISPHIYSASVDRIIKLVCQSVAIGLAFELQGIHDAIKLDSDIFNLIDYYQSRRRHIISLFYCLPHYCKGENFIKDIDSLNHFLPLVEYNCNHIYGFQKKFILSNIYPEFHMEFDEKGGYANYDCQFLGDFFLEPERLSITDIDVDESSIEGLECFDRKSIFTSEELRNSVLIINHAYDEFMVDKVGEEFSKFGELSSQLTRWCYDGYNIELDEKTFKKIMGNFAFGESAINKFIVAHDDYSKNSNTVAPFIKLSGIYITTITLLNRFLYFHKNRILERSRRFKIRAGFIFEDGVKSILEDEGFKVSDVKRINRKEFDVIVLLDDCVLNIQCKNNSIELADVSSNPDSFVRYNRFLSKYYERSLNKEIDREWLLMNKFSCSSVVSIVLSKFPIVSANASVVNFRDFSKFLNGIKI
jgi:hypothetical protein